jgi:hypothetical protein
MPEEVKEPLKEEEKKKGPFAKLKDAATYQASLPTAEE